MTSLLVSAWLMMACPAADALQPSRETGRTHEATSGGPGFHIGPQDVLDIVVWNNALISRTVPVRPDGMVSLPLLNDVPAAGLTPGGLRGVLLERLAEFMPDPEVSVIVREIHSHAVSVIGRVRKPGRFELNPGSTVLDMLALAEGMNEFASPSRILVLRRGAGGAISRLRFNYNRVMNGNHEENFVLQPGDILVVP